MDEEKCCSSCVHWHYDRWTEEKYGMGVGICTVNNQPTFCDRNDCMFHDEKEEV